MKSAFTVPVTTATLPPDGLYPCRCRILGRTASRAALYVTRGAGRGWIGVYIFQNIQAGNQPAAPELFSGSGLRYSRSVSFTPTALPPFYATLETAMEKEDVSGLVLSFPVCPDTVEGT